MFLFQKIEELGMGKNSSAAVISAYILEDRSRILKKNLQDIAAETYTSKASVVRFAQALGFHGWKDFLQDYVKELNYQAQFSQDIDFNFPFEAGSTTEEIARNLRTLAVQTLDDTLENLNYGDISRAVNLMQRASRIVVFCVSPHTYIASLFQRKMMTIQKPTQVVVSREMGISARSMTSQDLAIIISYAGENPDAEPMKVVSYLREHKIPMIAITSAGSNYLRQQVSTVLTMTTRENLYNKIATFSTEESVLYLLNLLYACFFARQFERNRASKTESARILEKHRTPPGSIHK